MITQETLTRFFANDNVGYILFTIMFVAFVFVFWNTREKK